MKLGAVTEDATQKCSLSWIIQSKSSKKRVLSYKYQEVHLFTSH